MRRRLEVTHQGARLGNAAAQGNQRRQNVSSVANIPRSHGSLAPPSHRAWSPVRDRPSAIGYRLFSEEGLEVAEQDRLQFLDSFLLLLRCAGNGGVEQCLK
jgi:hypothetical protein